MTKTENYQLNQWEATDKISREDFNSDNAAIDAALATMNAELGTLAASVDSIGKCVVGSYTGNGKELSAGGLFVELGFTPKFVIISRGWPQAGATVISTYMITEHKTSGANRYGVLNEAGFTVGLCSEVGDNAVNINSNGTQHSFVAFG